MNRVLVLIYLLSVDFGRLRSTSVVLKFIYSEEAIKFDKSPNFIWRYSLSSKQYEIFVAYSEDLNFAIA